MPRAPRPYANPYVAGTCLGLVLLAAFVLTGRGLGASGAFAATGTSAVRVIAPEAAQSSLYFSRYLDADGGARPWQDWLVIEIIGVVVGGLSSAVAAGRWRLMLARGAGVSPRARIAAALSGGAAMGAGAVLARGCTSGQALTGGATLSVGSWIFIAAAFGSAYASAYPMRALWRITRSHGPKVPGSEGPLGETVR